MLLMKVSAIIIEIVTLVTPYETITPISRYFVTGNLVNWHYDV